MTYEDKTSYWLHATLYDSFIRDTRPIHMWFDVFIFDMTHTPLRWSCVISYAPLQTCEIDMKHWYVPWLLHLCHDSFIRDVTHSYVTWLFHMWRDSFTCDMTHIPLRSSCDFVWATANLWNRHESCIRDMTHSYVTWLLHMWRVSFTRDVTHSYVWHEMTHSYVTWHLLRNDLVVI